MRYKHFIIVITLFALSACEHFPPLKKEPVVEDPSVVVFEEPEPVEVRSNDEIMSNENVIVYPVEGNLSKKRQEFPEYRGVMENTTRGGYTVFDSSVTVFAVEGTTHRPQYLPRYSVPQYAEQYVARSRSYTQTSGPLVPMAGETFAQPVPIAPKMTEAGRRSAPVLTAYE